MLNFVLGVITTILFSGLAIAISHYVVKKELEKEDKNDITKSTNRNDSCDEARK